MRMTQKRFNRVGGYVYDGDKCISHFEDVSHRDDIIKLLNGLHEELEPIKKICEKYRIPLKDLPEILEEYIAYDNDDDW